MGTLMRYSRPHAVRSDNVRVCVRVRPINEREKNEQKVPPS